MPGNRTWVPLANQSTNTFSIQKSGGAGQHFGLGGKVFGTLHSIQCYNSYIQSINTQLFKSKCPSTPIALNIGGDGHFGLVRGESLGGGSKGGGAKFFLVISFEIH